MFGFWYWTSKKKKNTKSWKNKCFTVILKNKFSNNYDLDSIVPIYATKIIHQGLLIIKWLLVLYFMLILLDDQKILNAGNSTLLPRIPRILNSHHSFDQSSLVIKTTSVFNLWFFKEKHSMKHRKFQSNNSLLNYHVLLNRDLSTVTFNLFAITKKKQIIKPRIPGARY